MTVVVQGTPELHSAEMYRQRRDGKRLEAGNWVASLSKSNEWSCHISPLKTAVASSGVSLQTLTFTPRADHREPRVQASQLWPSSHLECKAPSLLCQVLFDLEEHLIGSWWGRRTSAWGRKLEAALRRPCMKDSSMAAFRRPGRRASEAESRAHVGLETSWMESLENV